MGELRRLLKVFPGIGPTGAGIFLREAPRIWPEASPYLDAKARQGARRLKLLQAPERLPDLAGRTEPALLAAALVRAALDKDVTGDALARAASR